MSWQGIKWVMQDVELVDYPPTDTQPGVSAAAQFAVLSVLAFYANSKTTETYPSVGTIAATTHLSESVVRRALRVLELEEVGFIQGPHNDKRRLGGRNMSTHYHLKGVVTTAFDDEKPGREDQETRSWNHLNPVVEGSKPGRHDPRDSIKESKAACAPLKAGAAQEEKEIVVANLFVALREETNPGWRWYLRDTTAGGTHEEKVAVLEEWLAGADYSREFRDSLDVVHDEDRYRANWKAIVREPWRVGLDEMSLSYPTQLYFGDRIETSLDAY